MNSGNNDTQSNFNTNNNFIITFESQGSDILTLATKMLEVVQERVDQVKKTLEKFKQMQKNPNLSLTQRN